LEGIFLTERLLGIFVLAVRAQDLACQRLTILFRIATGSLVEKGLWRRENIGPGNLFHA
jgi:hypothetical protein